LKEYKTRVFDSTAWNEFPFRNDDIVIATYAKAGTTWVQQVVAQLLFNGRDDVDVAAMSPFVEERRPPIASKLALLEAQTHRRFMKTHLPADSAAYVDKARYIYVGRAGRDVAWSLYNHHLERTEEWYKMVNQPEWGEPIGKPSESKRDYFIEWVKRDGYPFWPFWENLRSWWQVRSAPNVMLLHFLNLKEDLPGQIKRVASFLDIPIDPNTWDSIVEHCSFDYMKNNADRFAPGKGALWKGGAQTFFHKGQSGRWRDELTAADCEWYEGIAREQLGDDCAHWLKTGEGVAPK
jgi:aryl sulfotransferase